MNRKSPSAPALACVLALLLIIPFDVFAGGQTAGQRAGEVSRLIPAVSIARGSESISAAAKTVVDWQDVLNTQANARARVALDDGSVLNVGADSSVRIAQHNAAAQQTDLEISLGKMRSQAQKITQPNGKFEVHTPAGVAGVVGTDFYVGYENNVMNVIVFDGIVRVCNNAGVCVEVKAGQMTSIRNGDSTNPVVTQASPTIVTEAVTSTAINEGSGVSTVHHLGKGTVITLGILAAVPIIVVPIVVNHGNSSTPSSAVTGCPPSRCG